MKTEPLFVRVVERTPSPLTKYLIDRRRSFENALGENIAQFDLENLRNDIGRLTNRINEFLQSPRQVDTQLVLGRVQSGKTSHMIGLAAWCVDKSISAVVVLSGSTESLANQTYSRFNQETTGIGNRYFKMLEPMPTESASDTFLIRNAEFAESVANRVAARRDGGEAPLPVLTVLKTAPRIEALHELFAQVALKVGNCDPIIVLDDEADQVSQNSKIRMQKRTRINQAIISLQDTGLRMCLVAYTATPQAILLSERSGQLQPRAVTVLQPGSSYFGLNDAMSEGFSRNRITLKPVTARAHDTNTAPEELYPAVIQFLITSVIRQIYPEVFFDRGGLHIDSTPNGLNSCQMLIHPSGQKIDHKRYRILVSDCLESLKRRLSETTRYDSSNKNFESFNTEYHSILKRLNNTSGLPEDLTEKMMACLRDSLSESTQIKVVNSDPNRPNADEPLPVEDKEWEQFKNWILIGGDILGRGITIPMLVVTYFLRNPKKSNFDTAVQQMRFCGYRQRYCQFTSIWAPADVLELYEVITEVDDVLLRSARQWDVQNLDLLREKPAVLYLSKPHNRLEPTRKNVIDPGIRDRVFKSSTIFDANRIFVPTDVRRNSDLVWSTFEHSESEVVDDGTWSMVSHVESSDIQLLLANWKAGIESPEIRQISSLFDAEFDALGLGQIPCTIFIRFLSFFEQFAQGQLPTEFRKLGFRSIADPVDGEPMVLFEDWKTVFGKSVSGSRPMQWFDRNSIKTYLGDMQRRIRRIPLYDSVSVFIEPLQIYRKGSKETLAIGLGLAIVAPDSFEVRLLGFDS
jgi:hypothetical protein